LNLLKRNIAAILQNPFLLLIGLPIFIYFNSLYNDFVNLDDLNQVYQNTAIQNLTFKKLKLLFSSSLLSMYQPLTSLSFAGIVAVFGVKSAIPFHAFSFLLHLANLLLVYCIGLKIFKNKKKAIFLSLLFSTHPFAVETVSWISATSTLMFSFFFLSAMYFYIKYLEINTKKDYFFSLLLFFIGCFCKVQIIPFVGVLFLIDYLYKKQLFSKKNIFQKIPFIVLAIIFAIIALNFRNQELAKNTSSLNYSKFYFAIHQFSWYIVKLFAPFNYSIMYNWAKEITRIHHVYTLVSLPLLFLVFYLRKNRLLFFGILFFLMNIVLHTTFFSKLLSPYAARYLYLSSIGIWIVVLSFNYKKKVTYFGIVFLGFLILLAKEQTKVWKNTKTLFEYSLKTEPKLAIAHLNLGVIYVDSDPKKAEGYFLKAAELEPKNPINYNNLGFIYKDIDKKIAEQYYLKALKVNPNYVNSYNNLGNLYMTLNPIKAEYYFLAALRLNPKRAVEFYNNLEKTFKSIDSLKARNYFIKAEELKN
jgi:hypothetical protein